MKLYISADIEGVTGVTSWDETEIGKPGYERARERMTEEVVAACDGAGAAGVDEIWVKDAHDRARNLVGERLPRTIRWIRGWSGHPLVMMQEVDPSFDAAMAIGYHARAGAGASPLEHSFTPRVAEIRLNDRPRSEFAFAAYSAALHGVPMVLVAGDEGVCAEASELCPAIAAVPVKRGVGGSTISLHPEVACDRIRSAAETALEDPSACRIQLPDRFALEIVYREQADAYAGSFYPGATLSGPNSVRYEATDLFEILRALKFLVL